MIRVTSEGRDSMRSLNTISTVILVLLIASAAYLGGYATATLTPASLEHGNLFSTLMAPPQTPVPNGAGEPVGHLSTPEQAQDQFKPFWEVWNLIDKEYYDRSAVDQQKLIYGAIKGMVDTLGDSHTIFVPPERTRQINEDMSGNYEGIGTTVELRNNRVTIVAPFDGSPAQKADLRAGDVILKIDGKSVDGLSLNDVVTLIKGPQGSKVKITIERANPADPQKPQNLDFEITRDKIRQYSVNYKQTTQDSAIAYVSISGFNAPTSDELQDALKRAMEANPKPKGLILDLRNNPGGYLHTAVEVASQFIKQKTVKDGQTVDSIILYEQHSDGTREPFKVKPSGQDFTGGLATDIPMVVLVNGGSASASEIVAGALQDTGRATIIGTLTYGKGSVQNVHELSDHSSFRVTVAHWLTPSGRDINGKGVIPDIEVKMTDADTASGNDPQLGRAVEFLEKGK